jgi:hypothetical protein
MAINVFADNQKVTSYEGCVLDDREENHSDDSDFYALVWDEASKSIQKVFYGSTRYYSYGNYAEVDASEEVKEKAQKFLEDVYYKIILEEMQEYAKRPKDGSMVRVVRGRTAPIGTVGAVFWMKEINYNGNTTTRVGIKDSDGKVYWTYLSNIEVVDPTYRGNTEDLKRIAKNAAAKRNWGLHLAERGMHYL